MISFELNPSCKLNLWVNDSPELNSSNADYVEMHLPACVSTSQQQGISVTAELYILTSPSTNYGLLTGEYIPDLSKELKVSVAVSDETLGSAVSWALGSRLDQIYSGLPMEYTESIRKGAIELQSRPILGAGCLNFHQGAHGLISSSGEVFRRIARLIVFLLASQGEIPSEEKMIELLDLI